ncbi:MAG: YSC84-related protein [Pseudomonadota bacterium]
MLTRRHLMGGLVAVPMVPSLPAYAEDADVIDARVNLALGKMYSKLPNTRQLSSNAKGMLVMPSVLKGGFVFGGAYGEGSLLMNDPQSGYQAPSAGYYSVAAASVGFQLGVQTTSHVLFFMTDNAVENFKRADGWEVGADAEVTFPDAGLNAGFNSTLLQQPVIGVVFGQDGFLVGASLEGAKYSRVYR